MAGASQDSPFASSARARLPRATSRTRIAVAPMRDPGLSHPKEPKNTTPPVASPKAMTPEATARSHERYPSFSAIRPADQVNAPTPTSWRHTKRNLDGARSANVPLFRGPFENDRKTQGDDSCRTRIESIAVPLRPSRRKGLSARGLPAISAMKPPHGCRVGAMGNPTPRPTSRPCSASRSSTLNPTPVCTPRRLAGSRKCPLFRARPRVAGYPGSIRLRAAQAEPLKRAGRGNRKARPGAARRCPRGTSSGRGRRIA